MSNPEPIENLATALRECIEPSGRTEHTERPASALHECLNHAATEAAANTAIQFRTGFTSFQEIFDGRVNKHYATLRLLWKQMGGNGRPPIDD